MLAMVGAKYTGGLFETLLLVSWPVVALFAAGTAFVVLLLFHFLKEERYRRPPGPEKGVEFVAARRAVEARVSALAPKVMLIVEREKFVAGRLEEGTLSEEARRMVEKLLREAVATGFWRRFAEASALADSDPVRAHEELGRLSTVVETALEKLNRAEESVEGGAGPSSRDQRGSKASAGVPATGMRTRLPEKGGNGGRAR